jgi:uncharacterized membrane protein YfcA
MEKVTSASRGNNSKSQTFEGRGRNCNLSIESLFSFYESNDQIKTHVASLYPIFWWSLLTTVIGAYFASKALRNGFAKILLSAVILYFLVIYGLFDQEKERFLWRYFSWVLNYFVPLLLGFVFSPLLTWFV